MKPENENKFQWDFQQPKWLVKTECNLSVAGCYGFDSDKFIWAILTHTDLFTEWERGRKSTKRKWIMSIEHVQIIQFEPI